MDNNQSNANQNGSNQNKHDSQSEQYILNTINKGLKMGMDSISTISEKVGDSNFKDDLIYQYNQYNDILNRVNTELQNFNDIPSELPPMQKAMGYMEIQMGTMNDKSNSHIAEMLIKGTNMGIIEGVKLKNQNPNANQTIQTILDDFISFQENTVEKLKKYL